MEEGGLSWSAQLPDMPEGQDAFVLACSNNAG